MMTTAIMTKKVLVCDDDPDILELLKTLLSNSGYSVSTAMAHEEFFDKIDEFEPDLILLDIRMPEHDGFWIAEELQRLDINIPIIFVSAPNRSVYRLCAPIAGAVDFIIKPFEPDVLLDRVSKALKMPAKSQNWFLYAASYKPKVHESTE